VCVRVHFIFMTSFKKKKGLSIVNHKLFVFAVVFLFLFLFCSLIDENLVLNKNRSTHILCFV